MLEDHQMGSQTLEILRQGVWASLTGGWFYDPHQDIFCNTFHLYVWLFLLCLPFSIYVYFPPTQYVWYFYCGSVTLVLMVIKLLNYAMHHMYDTTECIEEEIDDWERSKREEDIELQVLPTKTLNQPSTSTLKVISPYAEAATLHSTDAESLESDFPQIDMVDGGTIKPNSTIDLKVEVHRKNSSGSSEDLPSTSMVEVVTHGEPSTSNWKSKRHDKKTKHQRSKTDGCVTFSIKDEKQANANYKKLFQQDSSTDSQENGLLIQHQPSLQSVESEQGTSNFPKEGPRRHSNFTNSSLNFLSSSSIQADIKPTGSLELGCIDKNPNQVWLPDGLYFKANYKGAGVRRIRSTVLEACCPLPSLTAHPNSLELIGCKSTRNPLPPPSTSLIRNQHLKLCPYYGSEIVYPIAEQSDEHQTSHGPDTDLESLTRESDSDFEDNNQGSHSPLIYIKLKKPKNVPYTDKYHPKPPALQQPDEEQSSTTSKEALLDNDASNSNSSVTPDMQDARVDCYVTDNDGSDKKSSECSPLSCSSTSVESLDKTFTRRLKEHSDSRRYESGDQQFSNCRIVRKKNIKRNKRRKSLDKRKSSIDEKFSSLVELDLDWLFENENHCLQHRKEPLKRETEWSSTTTVSLEHDVSKVLQEPMPSTRSLGAIPKKTRNNQSDLRKPPKSESDKCTMCKSKPEHHSDERRRNRSMKENKVTQTLRQSDSPSPVAGLECIVSSPKQNRSRSNIRSSINKDSRPPNVELNNLLPAEPLLSAFLNSRRTEYPTSANPNEQIRPFTRVRLKRISRMTRRRSSQLENSLSQIQGAHGGKTTTDTGDGPVHCFLDEHGNWWVYKGDEKGEGASSIIIDSRSRSEHDSDRFTLRRRQSDTAATTSRIQKLSADHWDSNSNDEISSSNYADLSANLGVISQELMVRRARIHPSTSYTTNSEQNPRLRRNLCRNHSIQNYDSLITDKSVISVINEPEEPPLRNRIKAIPTSDLLNANIRRTKTYYKLKLTPWTFVKVTLDRLKLLALLDRNLTITETISSIFLGSLVSVLGAMLLHYELFEDIEAFVFCFIIASCQYSLLKSVQPDAASPTHGFNRVIAYSRPIYFCISSVLLLAADANIDKSTKDFGFNINIISTNQQILLVFRNCLIKFILSFPVLFSFGLFPQINTFLMYLLEQIDIYVFGGNAMSSLLAALYCLFRSIITVILLLGLAYGGLMELKSSQHVLFSIFCACLVAISYHLSRCASDPSHIWNIVKRHLWLPDVYHEGDAGLQEDSTSKVKTKGKNDTSKERDGKTKTVKFPSDAKDAASDEHIDPLPQKLQKTINARLKNDVILCSLIALLVFGIHTSTVFTVLQPELSPVLWSIAAVIGFFLHYIIPQLRKQLPWLCIARPLLRTHEHEQYQTRGPAKIMWFERIYIYFCFFERNILYPLLFLSVVTEDSPKIAARYGTLCGSFIVVICGLKCLRSSYSDQSSQYMILIFTALFFKYDYKLVEETFLVEYFIMSIVFHKFYELLLKVQFVVTYIAPWQITWGSAFHAFAQPFSVPHSAMLFVQTIISAVLSTPLNPFLGSAIFLTSYVRPVKFWERDYNTRRVDHSNTPLSSHLDRNLGADDNNLNSIFYEHLTRSLQHSLCGDLKLGRWGPVNQGDCFVLASDYLNCLVHIIEMGNDLVTFQMRGLEFRGTYCQQREVEAITEGVEENDGCCCCDTGHLPNMLSVNAAFNQRWLAWEVTAAKYILEGYSISDNSAVSMLQVFEFRKVLVSYYVKSIIFYTIRSPKLEEWISNQTIVKALQPMDSRNFVDLDPIFNYNIDEDYDILNSGMTRNFFAQVHGDWINYCVEKSDKSIESGINSPLVLLCFALSLLGRRTLSAASHNTSSNVEFFLYGLHALFKGDFRITCSRDEWVFTDMELLKTVVAPGVRMSLKLHQDHFMSPEEYEELPALYDAICKHEEELVISHEGDPAWRNAVLSGTPSLLALRHVLDDGTDEYKIIMLNKQYLSFRVIKINKECVRGLWAGQQQELVYLRNRNPERGSIQNAKQALRNIINSSCDQPIGYPIYVSPLTTSYAETNEQFCSLIGGSVSLKKIRNYVFTLFQRIRKRCGEGCSSGAANREDIGMGHEGIYAMTPISTLTHHNSSQSTDGSHLGGSIGRGSSLSRTSLGGNRGSLVSMGKPTSSTLASLAGLFKERDERSVSQAPDAQSGTDERLGDTNECGEKENISRARIIDPNLVYDAINLGRRIDVHWPTEFMRLRGGRSYWKDWVPEIGMEGPVVHKWIPCHKDPKKRSHVDRTILLVQFEDKYVPIAESGVQDLGPEV